MLIKLEKDQSKTNPYVCTWIIAQKIVLTKLINLYVDFWWQTHFHFRQQNHPSLRK